MQIECIWQGPAALAEGPVWHQQQLYWIDIAEHQLHRLNPETTEHQQWQMPALIGALDAYDEDHLIAGVGDNIVLIDITTGALTVLVDVIQGDSELRLNDGKMDSRGRFWVGVAHATLENPRGGLFRFDPDGSLHEMESGITISNGLGWSPDNRLFYYTDSLRRKIYRYDFDESSGSIHNQQLFAEVPQSMEPDGLTVDAQGFVWSAQWNGSKVIRFDPHGHIDQEIVFPTPRITSCAFGGADQEVLFVTTCSRNVGESRRLESPAGSIFSVTRG